METQTEVVDQVEEQESSLGSVEDRAKRMGWVEKEQFRGDPDRWVPPEMFIERAEHQVPILKGTLNTMEKKMAAQERLIKEQAGKLDTITSNLEQFVQFSKSAEQRAYERALKELRTQQAVAFDEQDKDKFNQVTAEIDEHLKNPPKFEEVKTVQKAPEPKALAQTEWYKQEVFDNWKVENPWYAEKPKMAAFAIQMDQWLRDNNPGLTHSQQLNKITELVKEEFPGYWSNPKRETAPTVEGGDGTAPTESKQKRGKSYNDLPGDAKRVCDEWVKNLPGFTREQYVRDFDWEGWEKGGKR